MSGVNLISPEEWLVAIEVCTQKQVAALDLWRRGYGARRIATHLDIDVSSARYRVKAARKLVRLELVRRSQVTP